MICSRIQAALLLWLMPDLQRHGAVARKRVWSSASARLELSPKVVGTGLSAQLSRARARNSLGGTATSPMRDRLPPSHHQILQNRRAADRRLEESPLGPAAPQQLERGAGPPPGAALPPIAGEQRTERRAGVGVLPTRRTRATSPKWQARRRPAYSSELQQGSHGVVVRVRSEAAGSLSRPLLDARDPRLSRLLLGHGAQTVSQHVPGMSSSIGAVQRTHGSPPPRLTGLPYFGILQR